MRRTTIRVEVDSVNHSAFISGYPACDLIEQCGGRPLYSRRRKAWSTAESTAADVVAMAEAEGYPVEVVAKVRDDR